MFDPDKLNEVLRHAIHPANDRDFSLRVPSAWGAVAGSALLVLGSFGAGCGKHRAVNSQADHSTGVGAAGEMSDPRIELEALKSRLEGAAVRFGAKVDSLNAAGFVSAAAAADYKQLQAEQIVRLVLERDGKMVSTTTAEQIAKTGLRGNERIILITNDDNQYVRTVDMLWDCLDADYRRALDLSSPGEMPILDVLRNPSISESEKIKAIEGRVDKGPKLVQA